MITISNTSYNRSHALTCLDTRVVKWRSIGHEDIQSSLGDEPSRGNFICVPIANDDGFTLISATDGHASDVVECDHRTRGNVYDIEVTIDEDASVVGISVVNVTGMSLILMAAVDHLDDNDALI
jgi:hypothetical protein